MPEIQGEIMSPNRKYTAIYDVCCRFLSGKKIDEFSEDFLEMLLEKGFSGSFFLIKQLGEERRYL